MVTVAATQGPIAGQGNQELAPNRSRVSFRATSGTLAWNAVGNSGSAQSGAFRSFIGACTPSNRARSPLAASLIALMEVASGLGGSKGSASSRAILISSSRTASETVKPMRQAAWPLPLPSRHCQRGFGRLGWQTSAVFPWAILRSSFRPKDGPAKERLTLRPNAAQDSTRMHSDADLAYLDASKLRCA